jgi:hypothetical protein
MDIPIGHLPVSPHIGMLVVLLLTPRVHLSRKRCSFSIGSVEIAVIISLGVFLSLLTMQSMSFVAGNHTWHPYEATGEISESNSLKTSPLETEEISTVLLREK